MKSFGILVILTFSFVTLCVGCGCGGGCGSYASPRHCVRCCTQLVKRSSSSNFNDGNKISTSSSLQELLEKWYLVQPGQLNTKYDVLVEKRDTCGCNLGCFYSSPMECARCCSHGVRRDTDQNEYQEIVDDQVKNVKQEQMSELIQLVNLMVDSENERRRNRNDFDARL